MALTKKKKYAPLSLIHIPKKGGKRARVPFSGGGGIEDAEERAFFLFGGMDALRGM